MNFTIEIGGFTSSSETSKIIRKKGNNLIDFTNEYIVIDTETTGLDPSFDEIIELSALKIKDDKIIDSFTSLVKPKYEIDEYITELTGITNDMVKNAPTIREIINDYYNFISNSVLVGHNINFDINFLYDELMKTYEIILSNDFIDTMKIGRRLLKDLKHHRLIDLAKNYNISTEGNHRSLKDCEITLDIYKNLKEEAIKQYSSIEEFQKSCRHIGKSIDISSIKATVDEIDENNPLYGKEFVFTGTLERMLRKDAMQIVVNFGGICGNSVTKETNYLVLGNNDYCSSIKDGKSNKHKKAEQLKLQDFDIEIISENVFYDMCEVERV